MSLSKAIFSKRTRIIGLGGLATLFLLLNLLFLFRVTDFNPPSSRKELNEPAKYADEARKQQIWGLSQLDSVQSPVAGKTSASATTRNRTIPKSIYTFWDKEPAPFLIKACLANWRKMNPSHTVTLITYSNLDSILDLSLTPLPRNFYTIESRYQADWIRLAILLQKGGFWVDASFIMLHSLDKIHSIQQQDQSEGFQFNIEKFTKLDKYPVLENWFIAAIPHATFIKAWFLEWCFCIEEFALDDSYLHHISNTYGQTAYDNIKQDMDSPSYLKQHVALQKVLQLYNTPLPSFSGATAQPDGPFSLIASSDNWNSDSFVDHLIFKWSPLPNHPFKPNFIKVRGWERLLLNFQITQGLPWLSRYNFWKSHNLIERKRYWKVECGSIYCDYLGGPMMDPQCSMCFLF